MSSVTAATDRRPPLWALGACLLVYLLAFSDSLLSMAAIWLRSDTYAHGMLILPISLWLIWRRREVMRQTPLQPDFWVLVALTGFCLTWLLGVAADMLVVEQLAATLILLSLVASVLGRQLFMTLLFPLLYLIFAVPFGEELTPSLQQVTAEITVRALRLTGIPVYINGLFIEIPSGRFEVAEACSGIRYLIASFALGTLYAYLTFHRLKSRAIFMIASLLVPVLANGLRAYMIVMIAHLSEMQYATGIDHLIYGWLFFGVVMAIMFWVGSWWSDPDPEPLDGPTAAVPKGASTGRLAAVVVLAATVMLATQAAGLAVKAPPAASTLPALHPDLAPWTPIEPPPSTWKPVFIGADRSYQATYRLESSLPVGLYIADYRHESQGKELINHLNGFYDKEAWTLAKSRQRTLQLEGRSQTVIEQDLRAIDGSRRRIWYWYRAYGRDASRALEVKLLQALNRLTGADHLGSAVAVMVDYEAGQDADGPLLRFLEHNRDRLPVIYR